LIDGKKMNLIYLENLKSIPPFCAFLKKQEMQKFYFFNSTEILAKNADNYFLIDEDRKNKFPVAIRRKKISHT